MACDDVLQHDIGFGFAKFIAKILEVLRETVGGYVSKMFAS